MSEEHYGAVLARIEEHMRGADQKLAEVLNQVKATNGRLRTAEKWIFVGRFVMGALIGAVGWLFVFHVKP